MKSDTSALRQQPAAPEFVDWGIDLGEILSTLLNAKKTIIVATIVSTVVFGLYAFLAQPVYEVDTMIQVEDQTGSQSNPIAPLFSTVVPVEAESEILQSRSVLGKVVDKLGLTIVVTPDHFPIFGGFLARKFEKTAKPGQVAEPWLWFDSYAWGGEKVKIDSLDVPVLMEDQDLTLVAGKNGQFTLEDPHGNKLVSGHVGELATANGASILISKLQARPGTEFTVDRNSWIDTIQDMLDNRLDVSEKGSDTQLMSVVVDYEDPHMAMDVANSIAHFYVKQNADRTAQMAQTQLDFLQKYLPGLKGKMEASQARMNQYMSDHKTLDMDHESQLLVDLMVENQKNILTSQLNLNQLKQTYNDHHPLVVTAKSQLQKLEQQREQFSNRVAKLPTIQRELINLTTDSTVDQDVYTYLMTKIQDLRILKAGSIGNVRVVDSAYLPMDPVEPQKAILILAGFFAGFFLSIVWVLVREQMNQGIEDYTKLEKELGISVYAVIPHVREQRKINELVDDKRNAPGSLRLKDTILAQHDSKHIAIESLRGLRTNIHFQQAEAQNNIIMISGASPSVGKTFISANLASILADTGKRVLLIDADMRKGHLNPVFSVDRSLGLTSVLADGVSPSEVIHEFEEVPNLYFMATGVFPPNPSELLMGDRFSKMLENLTKEFDTVLIDTPPILACTDAAIIGEKAGSVFLVLRSNVNTRREVEQAVGTFRHIGVGIDGFIFNDMRPRASLKGYGQYAYHYHYAYD